MVAVLLAGCGATTDTSVTKTKQSSKTTSVRSGKDDKSKVLVIYYSATGSTKAVAQTIAKTTGGDLFELVPTKPYSDDDLDWTDKNSRVSKENKDTSLRDVELEYNSVDDFDSYDTVFIGYPIWWGIAAWPVNSFVQLNDFKGKAVIPFCTSTSSGIGDSGKLLEEQAGSGKWQEGKRFSSGASSDEVEQWVKGLNI
ncbi:flavodoxin [Eubacterium sp. MSJ-13]|nr:flavodoxin [Eubacterium sp. MSJ-13]